MPGDAGLDTDSAVLPSERDTFRAIVSTIVPEACALDSPAWSRVEQVVEAALRDRPAHLKRQLRLALRGIQWLPVLRFGKRFTALSAAQRTRFLAGLQNHRSQQIRVGFWGLRTLALLGYYGRPEAAREIGYTGDPRGWDAYSSGNRDIGTRGHRDKPASGQRMPEPSK